jgi:hypothetical protein
MPFEDRKVPERWRIKRCEEPNFADRDGFRARDKRCVINGPKGVED